MQQRPGMLSHDIEAGFSLASVLVAIGLAGILAMALAQVQARNLQAQRSVELRGEAEAIRRHILDAIDCGKTLGEANVHCADGNLVLRARNRPLTEALERDGVLAGAGKLKADWFLKSS